MSDDFLMAAGNDSYWMTVCEGDFTHDPFNACQIPRSLAAPPVSGVGCWAAGRGLCERRLLGMKYQRGLSHSQGRLAWSQPGQHGAFERAAHVPTMSRPSPSPRCGGWLPAALVNSPLFHFCPLQEEPAVYKVQLKLSCAEGVNDTVALEATAALGLAPDGNLTVSAITWKQIPLPGVGQ